ncbi:MAG: hypothetical protein ACHP65_01865 [Legionellales bacterium]
MQSHPKALLVRGKATDYSGREIINSSIQYAAETFNVDTLRMMSNYIPLEYEEKFFQLLEECGINLKGPKC